MRVFICRSARLHRHTLIVTEHRGCSAARPSARSERLRGREVSPGRGAASSPYATGKAWRPEEASEMGGRVAPADVIVVDGRIPVPAVMAATKSIPVLMATAGDQVALGYVQSLSWLGVRQHPVFSLISGELNQKRLDLLRAAFPKRRTGPACRAASPRLTPKNNSRDVAKSDLISGAIWRCGSGTLKHSAQAMGRSREAISFKVQPRPSPKHRSLRLVERPACTDGSSKHRHLRVALSVCALACIAKSRHRVRPNI